MSGFASYDEVINALTVDLTGEEIWFNKASVTLVASGFYSLWAAGGFPGAGGYGGSAKTQRNCDSTTTGAIAPTAQASGKTKHLLGVGANSTVAAGTLLLVDRVADYPSIDPTSAVAQTLTPAALARYIGGAGLMMFLEIQTALTGGSAGTSTAVVTYTNQAAATGRTAGSVALQASGGAAGRLWHNGFFIPLQAGDNGVQEATSIVFASSLPSAGTCNLVLCKPLVALPLMTANAQVERDLLIQTPKLPKLDSNAGLTANACLQWLILANTTSSGVIDGSVATVAN